MYCAGGRAHSACRDWQRFGGAGAAHHGQQEPHLNPYIVVVRCDGAASEQNACALLGQYCQKVVVKSKTARAGMVELNVEVRLRSDDTSFVNDLAALPGVADAALVSYNGDYLG